MFVISNKIRRWPIINEQIDTIVAKVLNDIDDSSEKVRHVMSCRGFPFVS